MVGNNQLSTSQILVRPVRKPSFLDTSLRIDGIIDLLKITDKGAINFTRLCNSSQIKFKKSFLKYLRYCVDQGFMTKTQVSKAGAHKRYHALMSKSRFYTYYHITNKGKTFLELVE